MRIAAAFCLALAALAAHAQPDWPKREVRVLVGFTAGGTTDIIARLVGQELNRAWGVPFVVENRPGATGNMVFYGQAEGPYATLSHLALLKPGDEIVVNTDLGQYHYRVRSVAQVSEDNVDVVAATTTAVATLITDVPNNQQQRLVVVADLAP